MPKLKSFQNQNKTIYSQSKIDVEPDFWIFTRMSVRGMNKAKRQLRFVLMTLNIIKVTTQRAENNQKIIKDNFYIISIEIVFILSWNFMSQALSYD